MYGLHQKSTPSEIAVIPRELSVIIVIVLNHYITYLDFVKPNFGLLVKNFEERR